MSANRMIGGNDDTSSEKEIHCPLCIFSTVSKREFVQHKDSERHIFNYLVDKFNRKREHFAKERHGVEINAYCSTDNIFENKKKGIVGTVALPDEDVCFELEVLSSSNEILILTTAQTFYVYPSFSISDSNNITNGAGDNYGIRIESGGNYIVRMDFRNTGIGVYRIDLFFKFLHGAESSRLSEFWIIREIHVRVEGSEKLEAPMKVDERSPYEGERWHDIKTTIKGSNLHGKPIHKIVAYSIPKTLKGLLMKDMLPFDSMTEKDAGMLSRINTMYKREGIVTESNYVDFFHNLLYIDEHDAKVKISKYNMTNVTLNVINTTLAELVVPGLAEKRPSVLKGDIIYVRVRYGDNDEEVEDVQYEGCVFRVYDTKVGLSGFGESFMARLINAQNYNDPLRLDVRFTFSRLPLFMQHRAIDLAQQSKIHMFKILFPKEENRQKWQPLVGAGRLRNICFINSDVGAIAEQRNAVINILQGSSLPAPYILFGPPGTGKTATLVEAILQVKQYFGKSRILVCAPCNTACDYIAEKLYCSGVLQPDEIVRLQSPSREDVLIPDSITKISMFLDKSKCKLGGYRVLVCTLVTAGRLYEMTEEKYGFSHVFIDETGQAAECEALVGICGLLKQHHTGMAQGQLVLAGDPKQLGPVCHGDRADEWGLGLSLLERLMKTNDLYQPTENGTYDVRYITKLVQNFRSHPEILEIVNELFYEEELVAMSETVLQDEMCTYSLSGRRDEGRPVTFYGVIGEERKEGKSPSFFNLIEIEQVIRCIKSLFQSDSVSQDDIGVITPYVRQKHRLILEFRKRQWYDIEVGTVETFQGREKRIIIISTVRSQSSYLEHDRKYRLGFLKNPKRFCVVMTRAQAKCIIVGNPILLGTDDCWKKVINLAFRNGSYFGCPIVYRDGEWVEQVMNSFGRINLNENNWNAHT